jgi:ABC-2 type transport system permease protein
MQTNWIGLYTFIYREIMRVFRVLVQTIFSPLISATLYIFIFGHIIGTAIDEIHDVPYITYVFPGILMLNVISSAFSHSSSSVYFGRFIKSIEEVLIAPFSYIEIVIGYTISAVLRAVIVALGIMVVGLLFDAVSMTNFFQFFFYVVGVSVIFALIGILVGLSANTFEQLSILNTFVITPLTYLGGIFYSISMLPDSVVTLTMLNPFFYFVDGIRSSMTGIHEAPDKIGVFLIIFLVITLFTITTHLFKIGWRIRP